MPSHGVPQGSLDCPQLGGRFSHWSIKARSITAVFCSMLLISTKKLVFVAIRWRDVYWECLQIQQMSFYLIISVIWRCYFFISLKNIVGFIFYMIKYFVKQWFRKKKIRIYILIQVVLIEQTPRHIGWISWEYSSYKKKIKFTLNLYICVKYQLCSS